MPEVVSQRPQLTGLLPGSAVCVFTAPAVVTLMLAQLTPSISSGPPVWPFVPFVPFTTFKTTAEPSRAAMGAFVISNGVLNAAAQSSWTALLL